MINQISLFPDDCHKNIILTIEHDKSVDKWIEEHHYLHSAPAGAIIRMCFKTAEQEVIGCMMWGRPSARRLEQRELLQLTRMCFIDDTEHCVESKALSMARKHIRKHFSHVKGLVTYSSERHEGIIYKADNWYELGHTLGGDWENREGRTNRDMTEKIRWTRSP